MKLTPQKAPIPPTLIKEFNERVAAAPKATLLCSRGIIKMRHWIAFTGAVYPPITRNTLFKATFLVGLPGYDTTLTKKRRNRQKPQAGDPGEL